MLELTNAFYPLSYLVLENPIPCSAVLFCRSCLSVCPTIVMLFFAQKMPIPSLTLDLQTVVEFLALAACEAQGKKETGTDGLILPIHVYLTWI